jgi:hypothetical protein
MFIVFKNILLLLFLVVAGLFIRKLSLSYPNNVMH